MASILLPNWPAPTWIRAFTTLRTGGHSEPPFASFNLGTTAGDNPQHVALNRLLLNHQYGLPRDAIWLQQTHSAEVIQLEKNTQGSLTGDGVWSIQPGVPCLILTADCLPILLCDSKGSVVAAIHCGWRGILRGIIENAVSLLRTQTQAEILAWLGPAIGPNCFEVGSEVRDQFMTLETRLVSAFKPGVKPGKWMADIYELARLKLRAVGVNAIWGGDFCTYTDQERFFSYRRDGKTGRMASLIWIASQ